MTPETILPAPRILIVDDEPANVLLLRYILQFAGYGELFSTTDPHEAVRLFEAHEPDLILLDLFMPHVSGIEVMRRLGERMFRADCPPILVLTADNSETARSQALEAGASDFLTKPFDHVEVIQRVRHLLELRAPHQHGVGGTSA